MTTRADFLKGAAALAALPFLTRRATAQTTRPNILFIMTDDQPDNTMLAMPIVASQIRGMGRQFTNAYVSESLCCPSRATTFSGQYRTTHR